MATIAVFCICLVSLVWARVDVPSTKIGIVDNCTSNCTLAGPVLRYPQVVYGWEPHFNFTLEATTKKAVDTRWRYSVLVKLGGKVKVWQSSGVACGNVVFGDNIELVVSIDFPNCDAEPGPVHLDGNFLVGPPIEETPFQATAIFTIYDSDGLLAADLIMTMGKNDQLHGIEIAKGVRTATSRQSPHLLWPGTRVHMSVTAQNTALVKNIDLGYSPTFQGPYWDFNATIQLAHGLRSLRYGWTATKHILGKMPLEILVGNGSACGFTTEGDDMLFGLEVDFPACMSQSDLVVHGRTFFLVPFEIGGKLTMPIDFTDVDSGNVVASILVEVSNIVGAERRAQKNKAFDLIV